MNRELYNVYIKTMNQNTFEDYSKEVVETKYKLKFKSNRRTKDGGIDAISQNEEKILQVKFYNSGFNNLKKNMEGEVNKVPKIKAKFPKFNEYILVTSLELSVMQSKEIHELFSKLSIDVSIFGLLELDNEFSENEELIKKYSEYAKYRYDEIEKCISEALMIDNTSKAFFDEIKNCSYDYYRSTVFYETLNSVNYGKKITIVTGKAGMGKSTVCSMVLSSLLLENNFKNFYTMELDDCLRRISKIPNDSIIYIDDFIGHNIFDKTSNYNALEKIYKQIRSVNRNVKILCNSRDYILQEFYKNSYETYKLVNKDNISVIDSDKLTDIDKVSIVKNIIEKNVIYITEKDLIINCRKLINHKHFTPRNLEQIANKQFTAMDDVLDFLDSSIDLYKSLYNNLSLNLKNIIVEIYFLKSLEVSPDFRGKKDYDLILETIFVSVTENRDNYLLAFKNFSIYDYIETIVKDDYDEKLNYLLEKYKDKKQILEKLIVNSNKDDEQKYKYLRSFDISNPYYFHKYHSKSDSIKNDRDVLKSYIENAINNNYLVEIDDYLEYCKYFHKNIDFKYVSYMFNEETYLDLYLNKKDFDVQNIYLRLLDLDDFIIEKSEINLDNYRTMSENSHDIFTEDIIDIDYDRIRKSILDDYWFYTAYYDVFKDNDFDELLELLDDEYSPFNNKIMLDFKSDIKTLLEKVKIRLDNIKKVKEYQLSDEQINEIISSYIDNEFDLEADRIFEEERIEKYVENYDESSIVSEICESITINN